MSITSLKSRLAASFRTIINDTATRLVEARLAEVEVNSDDIVERVAARIAEDVGPEAIAEHVNISAVAANVDASDIAEEFDASDIAEHLDHSDIASHLDYSEIANYVDASDVADCVDASDIADYVDGAEVAESLDKDDLVKALASRLSPLEQLAAQGVAVVDEDAIAERAAEVALTAVVEVVEGITAPSMDTEKVAAN